MAARDHILGIAATVFLAACSVGSPPADSDATNASEAAPISESDDLSGTDGANADARVPGTDYHATTEIACGFAGAAPTQKCAAGVKRNWMENGSALVEVRKPDGFTRAIFYQGIEPFGADSAEADGSAGWEFTTTRDGSMVTVRFGPETYVIDDVLIEGG